MGETSGYINEVTFMDGATILLVQRTPVEPIFDVSSRVKEIIEDGGDGHTALLREPAEHAIVSSLITSTSGPSYNPLLARYSSGIISIPGEIHYCKHNADFSSSLTSYVLQSGSYSLQINGFLSKNGVAQTNFKPLSENLPSHVLESDIISRETIKITLPPLTGIFELADGRSNRFEHFAEARISNSSLQ